jgi:tetratricopeptide (TPR) repeat protein
MSAFEGKADIGTPHACLPPTSATWHPGFLLECLGRIHVGELPENHALGARRDPLDEPFRLPDAQKEGLSPKPVAEECAMRALKASICAAVTALALSLLPGAPSCAAEDEASTLTQQMKELYRAGKYTEALPLAQKSLALREKEFGPDDANVAMPLNDLGTIHYNLGQYAVAEPLYKRALAIREKTLGPDHPEVAMVLNNLGELYRAEEHYADAEPLLKRRSPSAKKRSAPTIRRSCWR